MISLALLIAANSASMPIMFGGPLSSMQKLTVAARKCGYKEAVITKAPFGPEVVSLPTKEPGVNDPQLDCLVSWVAAHPKLELGIIGNKPYE